MRGWRPPPLLPSIRRAVRIRREGFRGRASCVSAAPMAFGDPEPARSGGSRPSRETTPRRPPSCEDVRPGISRRGSVCRRGDLVGGLSEILCLPDTTCALRLDASERSWRGHGPSRLGGSPAFHVERGRQARCVPSRVRLGPHRLGGTESRETLTTLPPGRPRRPMAGSLLQGHVAATSPLDWTCLDSSPIRPHALHRRPPRAGAARRTRSTWNRADRKHLETRRSTGCREAPRLHATWNRAGRTPGCPRHNEAGPRRERRGPAGPGRGGTATTGSRAGRGCPSGDRGPRDRSSES